jgi:hypothetical protein
MIILAHLGTDWAWAWPMVAPYKRWWQRKCWHITQQIGHYIERSYRGCHGIFGVAQQFAMVCTKPTCCTHLCTALLISGPFDTIDRHSTPLSTLHELTNWTLW